LENLPNLEHFILEDPEKVKGVILETYQRKGPAYIRL